MQNEIEILNPEFGSMVNIPLCGSSVQAGFPSPAEDYLEDSLDLNEYLVSNKDSTFFVRVSGDSMINAGIRAGDILIVDKSISAESGSIIIAVLGGEFTVKRLLFRAGKVMLKAENDNFQDIMLSGDNELVVWGVVTSVIHKYV